MKKQVFTICIALSFLLLLSLTVSAEGKKVDAKGEMMEISWLGRHESGEDTAWFLEFVKEKFNVNIVYNGIAERGEQEKVQMMLAAGEMPDVGMAGDPYDLYNEGATRSLSKAMIRKYMPDYTKLLDSLYPLGWSTWLVQDKTDEYVSLAGIDNLIDGNILFWAFRLDWAKKVGFDLPTFEKDKISLNMADSDKLYFLDVDLTIDDMERLLVGFRDGDPDGNGKNDTIPWGASNSFSWSFAPIMGAFGVADDYNFMMDGKLTQSCIMPQYKDWLKLMAKWYKMGLIDDEFITIDKTKAWDKVSRGLTGACVACIDYAGIPRMEDRPPNAFATPEEAAEGAKIVMLPPPVGPGQTVGAARGYLPVGPVGRYFVNFGKQVTDEKLQKILQIMDYARYGGEEGWIYSRTGKPGVHFDWEGEPWQSMPLERKLEDVPEGYPKTGGALGDPPCYPPNKFKFIRHEKLADFYANYVLGDKCLNFGTIRPYRWDYANETNYVEINKQYGTTVRTIRDEFRLKVITGELDVDAEWDSYVANWRKQGGDIILAEMMKAPLVSELRKGNWKY